MRPLLVVASSLLLLLGAEPISAERTIRVKAAGDEHHKHHHSELPGTRHPVEELPYCVADPHEHLHWTIVGGVITALLVALIYVHSQYASMQYQHALLVRIYRSRARRDDADLDAIRNELKGRRMSARLSEYLDRKQREMSLDDVKTARDGVPSSARGAVAPRSKRRSVRRVRTEDETREDAYAAPGAVFASSPSPSRRRRPIAPREENPITYATDVKEMIKEPASDPPVSKKEPTSD